MTYCYYIFKAAIKIYVDLFCLAFHHSHSLLDIHRLKIAIIWSIVLQQPDSFTVITV